jgi:hypothetical protein
MKNVKTDYKTRQEMSQLLREAIVDYINEGAKFWLRDKQDLEMWDTVINDSDDLITIAGMIDGRTDESYSESNKESAQRPVNTKGWAASAGKDVEQAFMAACDLDTAVRDVFPRDVWNWMSFVSQEEKKEHWAKLDDGQKYKVVDDAGVNVETGKFTG